ncbi:MAG TPA: YcxB family protein [Armatimonadota bacterium]|nr:YcxB family protein [Armatimonadota bacterium]
MTQVEQDVIEVEGLLTREDYVRFVMWTTFRLLLVLRLMATTFVLLGLPFGVYFVWIGEPVAYVGILAFLLVGLVLWAVLTGSFRRSSAAKLYQTYKVLQEPIRYRFGPGGLSSASASSQGSLTWSAYYRVHETKHAFYLYLGALAANIIPKRFFDAEEHMQRFRELLRESLLPEVCKL